MKYRVLYDKKSSKLLETFGLVDFDLLYSCPFSITANGVPTHSFVANFFISPGDRRKVTIEYCCPEGQLDEALSYHTFYIYIIKYFLTKTELFKNREDIVSSFDEHLQSTYPSVHALIKSKTPTKKKTYIERDNVIFLDKRDDNDN